MKTSTVLSAVTLAFAITLCTQTARADNRDATCEVRKGGERQKGRSGPCTFGQRQGHIDIDLKNGDTFSLSPAGNGPDRYRDQKGNKVTRTSTASGMQFNWEGGTHLSVTFNAPTYHHNKHNQPGYNQPGGYGQDGVGSEHPWAADGGGSRDQAPPQIMVGSNGEGEVIFKNNCVVYYDTRGRRKSSLPACSSDQLNRAGDAMAAYRREQGMN
jgi:hypothetical protein